MTQDQEVLESTPANNERLPIPPPTPELYHDEKEHLEEGTREALDNLEEEVMGTPLDKMTPEELAEAANTRREGEIDYLERQTHNEDPEIASRAEFVLSIKEKMDALIDDVSKKVKAGEVDEAHEQVKQFLTDTREDLLGRGLEGEDVEHAVTQMQLLIDLDIALLESKEVTKSTLLTLTSFGMDLIPFVGGVKMMGEGALGKTLDGEKLEGMRRLMHMGEGALWEIVDVVAVAATLTTGVGGAGIEAVARGAKVAKTAPKLSKVLTRTGAYMRVNGVKGSKEVFKAGRVLIKNPKAEAIAQKTFEKGLKSRTNRVVRAAALAPGKVEELKEGLSGQAELLQRINDERAELTALLADVTPPAPSELAA